MDETSTSSQWPCLRPEFLERRTWLSYEIGIIGAKVTSYWERQSTREWKRRGLVRGAEKDTLEQSELCPEGPG